jgi:hypothetical protein
MRERPVSKLPARLGCPLALAITLAIGIAIDRGMGGEGRSLRLDEWPSHALGFAFIGAPFAVLALARTPDWLAWLVAVVLTAALWGYHLYELSHHEGVNFVLGPILMMAPLAISGICLSLAGMRGKVPHLGEDGTDG